MLNRLNYLVSNEFLGFLSRWLFLLLAFGYPIPACLSVLLNMPSTPINIAVRACYLGISIYIILISILKKEKLTISRDALPLLIFYTLYSIRILFDTQILRIEVDIPYFDVYSFAFGNIFLPMIAIMLSFKYVSLEKILKNTFFLLLLDNCLMIYLYLNQFGALHIGILLERAYIKSPLTGGSVINPISFGLYGAYLFLISLSILIIFSKKLANIYKIIAILGSILGLSNLILGTSRGPILFAILCLIFLIYLNVQLATFTFKYTVKFFSWIGLFLIIIFYFVAPKIQNIDIGAIGRFENMAKNREKGEVEERDLSFKEAFDQFLTSPIVGDQFVTRTYHTYPHNIFFELLMATGIIGFSIFILAIFASIKRFLNFKMYGVYFPVVMLVYFLSTGLSLTSGSLYITVDYFAMLSAVLSTRIDTSNIV